MVSVANNTVTLPMAYDDSNSILSYVSKPKRWRDLRPLEKILVFIIAAVSIISLALIIAVAVMGAKITRLEEFSSKSPPPPNPPEHSTGGNPGSTTPAGTRTTTGRGGGSGGGRTSTSTASPSSSSSNLCLSDECTIAAGEMLRVMDLSINPCKDFFRFACGKWEDKHPIPDSKFSWDQTDSVKDRILRHLHNILHWDKDHKSDPEPVMMATQFYDACVAQKSKLFAMTPNNYSVLKEFVEHLMSDYDQDIWKAMGHIRKVLQGNFLFSLKVDVDGKNASRVAIYLDQPSLGIPRSHFLIRNFYHDQYIETYQELIEDVWMKVFDDHRHLEAAENVIHLEKMLAEISTPPEQRINKSELYNPHTVQELYELTDSDNTVSIAWESYLDYVFFDVYDPEKKGNSWNKTSVIVRDVHFFHMLETTLAGDRNKTLSILRDFLTWKIIFHLAEDASAELRDLIQEFHEITEGLETPEPLWKICTQQTMDHFGMALSYHYIQGYFDEDHKKAAEELLEDIKKTLKKTLSAPGNRELGWMSPGAKQKAIAKLDQLQAFVAHPTWLVDGGNVSAKPILITELDHYYYHLQLDKDNDHFDNIIEVLEWESVENLKLFDQSRNKLKWIVDPISVLALYWPSHNSISLPAGILQHPFFGGPFKYLNYGALGSLLGHALIHSFDFKGKQYEVDGTLSTWWDEETERNYGKKRDCFMRQFKNYSINQEVIPIHWKQSMLDESLAENLGLKLAYKTYRSNVNEREERLLPGFNETANQMFFISYAQMWCSAFRNEVASSATANWYTPTQFRENGGLHGSIDFARAWSCPPPPSDANCNIWS